MSYKPKSYRWFLNRIGYKVYRDDDGCKCKSCKDVVEKGIEVFDRDHARYLSQIDCDFACDGTYLNYRDEK
jgi:hypothetical protein